jgi:C-terminal processing protease CtpA/Prc
MALEQEAVLQGRHSNDPRFTSQTAQLKKPQYTHRRASSIAAAKQKMLMPALEETEVDGYSDEDSPQASTGSQQLRPAVVGGARSSPAAAQRATVVRGLPANGGEAETSARPVEGVLMHGLLAQRAEAAAAEAAAAPNNRAEASQGGAPQVLTAVVELNKGKTGLGINFHGVQDEGTGGLVVQIKSINPHAAAGVDGRLRVGDQIHSVDGRRLAGLATQAEVIQQLQLTGRLVLLEIVVDALRKRELDAQAAALAARADAQQPATRLTQLTVVLRRDSTSQSFGFSANSYADGTHQVQTVRPGTVADGKLMVDDNIIKVGPADTRNITHDQFTALCQSAELELELRVTRRGVSAPSAPAVAGSVGSDTRGGGGTPPRSLLPVQPQRPPLAQQAAAKPAKQTKPPVTIPPPPDPTTIGADWGVTTGFSRKSRPFQSVGGTGTGTPPPPQFPTEPVPPPASAREVVLVRASPQQGFGFSVGTADPGGVLWGGAHVVIKVMSNGVAEGRIETNDILYAINGRDVTTTSHNDVIALIKNAATKLTLLVGKVYENETVQKRSAPPPSARRVVLKRRHPKESFGFSIGVVEVAGPPSDLPGPHIITNITPFSPSAGQLNISDIVFEVNRRNVTRLDHAAVVDMVRNAGSTIELLVDFADTAVDRPPSELASADPAATAAAAAAAGGSGREVGPAQIGGQVVVDVHGTPRRGVLAYVGGLKGAHLSLMARDSAQRGQWAGIIMDERVGNMAGSVAGVTYFRHCKDQCGLIVPATATRLVLARGETRTLTLVKGAGEKSFGFEIIGPKTSTWGAGGADTLSQHVHVIRVAAGGAARAGMATGDRVIGIEGTSAAGKSTIELQQIIMASTGTLQITVQYDALQMHKQQFDSLSFQQRERLAQKGGGRAPPASAGAVEAGIPVAPKRLASAGSTNKSMKKAQMKIAKEQAKAQAKQLKAAKKAGQQQK